MLLITFMICDDCSANMIQSVELENVIDLCPIVEKGKFHPVGCYTAAAGMEIYARDDFSPLVAASHDYNLILIVGDNPNEVVKTIWDKTDYMEGINTLEQVESYRKKEVIDVCQFHRFYSEVCELLEALPDCM